MYLGFYKQVVKLQDSKILSTFSNLESKVYSTRGITKNCVLAAKHR